MKFLLTGSFLLVAFVAFTTSEEWSWSKDKNNEQVKPTAESIKASDRESKSIDSYSEINDDSQEDVAPIPASLNDTQSRHIVRDKLCGLGLGECDDEVEPKRNIAPQDLIYAQPVHLKPVGRPIAAVPLKTAGSPLSVGYGPPRPVPFPSSSSSYDGPGSPYGGPISSYGGPGSSYGGPGSSYGGPGSSYGGPPIRSSRPGSSYSRPPPQVYESEAAESFRPNQPSVSIPASGLSVGGVQQHVHHHYHHGEGVDSVKVPTTIDSAGLGPISGAGPLYGSEGSLYGQNSLNSYGGNFENYETPGPFYKKQLNLKQPSNSIAGAYTNEKYPSYESPRADNYGCYCVPFDQCLPHEVARKEDGIAGIDPRNLGKTDIEAIGLDEVVITDGNGTIVSHHKVNEKDENKSKTRRRREAAPQDAEPRYIQKPTVDDLTSNGYNVELPYDDTQTDGRKLSNLLGGSSGGGGAVNEDTSDDAGSSGHKIRPTFGVSFGLPSGGGGYPISPFGPNPSINPYGHSLGGGNGLNLGLVSVNPLLSLQVSKDEYGEKIIKPWVNLHVTPNAGLVHKVGHLVHKLKEPHYGYGHEYPPSFLHQHNHYHSSPPSYHHGPSYFSPPKPFYHSKPPPYFSGSFGGGYGYEGYAPEYHSYRGDHDYDDHEGYGYSGVGDSSIGDYGHADEYDSGSYYRSSNISNSANNNYNVPSSPTGNSNGVKFPTDRHSTGPVKFVGSQRQKRDIDERQAFYSPNGRCGPRQVCCRRPPAPPSSPIYSGSSPNQVGYGQCGKRNTQGITGRIKTPSYVDGDSEFGEYPWQVAILKKDPQESVYVCGGTLIDTYHVLTAAHCIKTYKEQDLRVRLGEWDVNHDVEFYPYVEQDVAELVLHREFYAGTLYNDIAILRMERPVDFTRNPHISPACLPDPYVDFSGQRCWTTGWGKDAFGDYGKYQNILKEVDVPIIPQQQCQSQLQQTRLGYDFKLHNGFLCAGGEEGKDACKGDGGGPLVCERGGSWSLVGIVSWGVGCGQYGVPGVYVKVSHYLDWIRQFTNRY